MTPDDALAAIKRVLAQSSVSLGDIITRETNVAREDNRLEAPWVTIRPIGIPRSDPHDTDRVGFETDTTGRRVGRIFETTWLMDVQLDVYLPTPAPQDPNTLGYEVQQVLLEYDSKREAKPFPDGSGGTHDRVDHFRVGEAERRDELTAEYSLRRWYQEATMRLSDRASTTEDPIKTVDVPTDDEAIGQADGSIRLEYNP